MLGGVERLVGALQQRLRRLVHIVGDGDANADCHGQGGGRIAGFDRMLGNDAAQALGHDERYR